MPIASRPNNEANSSTSWRAYQNYEWKDVAFFLCEGDAGGLSPRPASDDPIYTKSNFPKIPTIELILLWVARLGPPASATAAPAIMEPMSWTLLPATAGAAVCRECPRCRSHLRGNFNKAAQLQRSCVVNLSLGTHGGPHDGSTLVEQDFDQLLSAPGRAIVISAGNSWERRSHASGRIPPGTPRTLTWEIGIRNEQGQVVDRTGNEVEVWYPGASTLEVTLLAPTGQRFGPTRLGRRTEIRSSGVVRGLIIHRGSDPAMATTTSTVCWMPHCLKVIGK